MEAIKIYRSLLNDPAFQDLLAYATGHVEKAVEKYNTISSWQMFGFYEGDMLVGCAGYEKVSQEKAILLHIAVDPKLRARGIGRHMVEYICKESRVATLEAETDRSAVDFYRKNGFDVTSLGEKYPGVERFRCLLHVER
jgi:N-acetylglutamate synthase-like GNAT family acetyltransferase